MSWSMVPIKDCARIVSGATPRSDVQEYWDGDVAWVTPKDLANLVSKYIEDTPRKITQAGLRSCSAEILPPKSVLFSSRAPIGHVAINTIAMATNQGFKSMVPEPCLDPDFLYWWLRAHRQYLENLGNGATFKEVSKAVVERIEIPLPPLAEQKRIAAILDQADSLRRLRQRAIDRLNTLGQAIFYEMFGDPAINPKGWPIGTIESLTASTQYGTSAKAGDDGAFPILRMGNITESGVLDFSSLKYIDLPVSDIEKYTVRDGDMLFNRTNSPDLVGKTGVYRGATIYAFAGYLVRLRTNDKSVPEYIGTYLNSPFGKRILRGMCKAIIGMANINAKELRTIPIPLPPIDLQREFQQKIIVLRSTLPPLERHRRELEMLFTSLQHRAFRGEL